MSIFNYQDYRKFLKSKLGDRPDRRSGARSRLAKHLGCHTTFVSHVLQGRADFSPEQALALTTFLDLDELESEYFVLLLQWQRAGTVQLQAYYHSKIERLRHERQVLKNQLEDLDELDTLKRAQYYSHWLYAAIHMIVDIPEFQTVSAIAAGLKISDSRALEVLQELERMQLIEHHQGLYQTGKVQLHLGSDSSEIRKHHTNWRLRALDSLDRNLKDEFHYSGIFTLSRDDFDVLKMILSKNLKSMIKTIQESNPEDVCSLNIDLFRINQS